MKKMTFLMTIATLSVASLAPVFALQQDKTTSNDYVIKAYKDCALVFEQPMTVAQIAAYDDLQEQAEKMDFIEGGIEGIDDQLELLSDEIDALTDIAIQETEDSLFIDKHMMAEQLAAVERLTDFMAKHEHKFEAISAQGDIISDYADKFTEVIEAGLDDVDYDDLRVVTPRNNNGYRHCDGVKSSM
ncbi:hypothetical protein [Alteromonas facilis]|uniref:hypothetical protein n=1 Tax=Alteromonas facilis TaxID=2048004 RepID=UPI000C2852C8|nr:hypothetical protein [Alteromonas facilis]